MANEFKAVVQFKAGVKLTLKSQLFSGEDEIDMDKLLRIDIANLSLEIVTFPMVLNQVGILLAQANGAISEAKMTADNFAAKRKETIRNNAADNQEEDEETGKTKTKAPKKLTIDEVDAKLMQDPAYQALKRKVFEAQKEQELISSLYWSMKSKDDKLNKLAMGIKDGDVYDAIVGTSLNRINYVDVRLVQPRD